MTKADLELENEQLKTRIQQVERLCLIRAQLNDMRGGAHVHAANTYRKVVKWFRDPEEIEKSIKETARWVAGGMMV